MKTFLRSYFFLLFSLISILSHRAFAATDPSIVQVFEGKSGSIKPDSVREITDLVFDNPLTRNRIDLSKPQNYQNTITLLINEQTDIYIPGDFIFEVTFDVQYTTKNGTVTTLPAQKLRVTYKKAEGSKYDARQYLHFIDGKTVKVTITSVNNFNASWDVSKVLRMENRMDITRDYLFNCSESITNLHDDGYSSPGYHEPFTDELKIKWYADPFSGLTHFDLEWAWCDLNILDRFQVNGAYKADLIFQENSSRVRIANQFDVADNGPNYTIPLMYDGEGYLFYRVRPVQYLESGQVVTGTWNSVGSVPPKYFYFAGHQRNLNWQSGTTYAEDGKRKSVVEYFDGTLRNRQTVSKDNARTEDNNFTATTIVAETFYDYQGRPVIEVLPSPTLNTIIKYAEGFNRFQGSAYQYPKDIYDLLPANGSICSSLTPPLIPQSGAAQYYSPYNPKKNSGKNKFIPDAFGYPYKETRYTDDGTGRIAAQGGVGIMHRTGESHDTRYYYGSVHQNELDGLFGTEAGDANHYFKNMVRDPNGQYTISYNDMKGRTVATALAGNNPPNLDELTSHRSLVQFASVITEELLSPFNNIVDGRQIVASKSLLVPVDGYYTFNYSLNPQSAEIIACTPPGEKVCYDCLYDLEIRISDNCGVYQKIISRSNFSLSSTPDQNCNIPPGSITLIDEKLYLTEGEYNITKTLSLSRYSQDWYRENVFLNKNICKTQQTFYDSIYQAMLQESNCFTTCQQCSAHLGTYESFRASYLQSQAADPALQVPYEQEIVAAYNELKKECDVLCTSSSTKLSGLKMQMLQDMSPPHGQYADITGIQKPFNIYNNLYNNFGPAGSLRYKFPLNESSQAGTYKNNLGQVDLDAHPGGTASALSFNSPAEFETIFKATWANSLLPYHPEYCKYKIASEILKASFEFDDKLQTIETFSAANSGVNYILNLLDIDPFFSVNGLGAAYRLEMKTKIESVYRKIQTDNGTAIYSMWQVAWMSINCGNFTTIDPECANKAPQRPPFIFSSCTSDWNKVWQVFRTIYLSEKNDYVNQFLTSQCPDYPANLNIILNQNGYQRRFGSTNEMFGSGYLNDLIAHIANLPVPPGIQTENESGPVQDSIKISYDQTCEGYKALWLQQLLECDQINAMRPDEKVEFIENVMRSLKDICIRGSDIYHYLGSASEKPGDPREFDDFEQALTHYFKKYGINITNVCHPYLITYPKKYNLQAAPSSLNLALQKDTCVCNKLNELSIRKSEEGYIGSVSNYLQYKHGVIISQGLIDTLVTGCRNLTSCKSYDPAVKIPGFLTCYSTNETCIGCNEYFRHIESFHSIFGDLNAAPFESPENQEQVSANVAFENYMNYVTGFSLNWQNYIQFSNACNNYNSAYDCLFLDSMIKAFNYKFGDNVFGVSCYSSFVQFFNQATGNYYTYSDLQAVYITSCGHLPYVCRPALTCNSFESVIDTFIVEISRNHSLNEECNYTFVDFFNSHFQTSYNWEQLYDLYKQLCGRELDVCKKFPCRKLQQALQSFTQLYHGLAWLYDDCEQLFTRHFNYLFSSEMGLEEIRRLYGECGMELNICNPVVECETLQRYVKSYFSSDYTCQSTFVKGSIEWCKDCFTTYMNGLLSESYSYEQISLLYQKVCGETMKICEDQFTCEDLSEFFRQFHDQFNGYHSDCKISFLKAFNERFKTNYTFPQIEAVYLFYCGSMPAICTTVEIQSCNQLQDVLKKFLSLYPEPAGYFGPECQQSFANFFNESTGTRLQYAEILPYYISLCGSAPQICGSVNCTQLSELLEVYRKKFGRFSYPQLLKRELFTFMYNEKFQPKEPHYWKDIVRIYESCDLPLTQFFNNEETPLNCESISGLKDAFYTFYPNTLPENCTDIFKNFFNLYYETQFEYRQIVTWAKENCNLDMLVCGGDAKEESISLTPSGLAIISPSILPPRLCGLATPIYQDAEEAVRPCDYIKLMALSAASQQYELYKKHQLDSFDIRYQEECLAAKAIEKFTVTYTPAEYHYTLYYYDQAGNLVKTIPPAGVHPDFSPAFLAAVQNARQSGLVKTPAHTTATEYRYNSLSQITIQKTPDNGKSKFWYDRLGRLVISQNAQQAVTTAGKQKYSYTRYDQLGRIVEVGEKPKLTTAANVSQAITEVDHELASWLNTTALQEKKQQITGTVYDRMYPPFCEPGTTMNILCQKNLRNRVSYTYTSEIESDNINYPWDAATFYSYDIHGNVDTLLQDFKTGMGAIVCNTANVSGNRFKKIIYDYDLVSGKVNKVAFQPGNTDQFYQRYHYDAENKLQDVESSRNKIYWEKDATYSYYRHGPLARTVLGTLQVQGIDFAYTLQGWLKGVNTTGIHDGNYDIGNDGNGSSINKLVCRDAFGLSLHYFTGDYSPIDNTVKPFSVIPLPLPSITETADQLFNGNISATVVNLPKFGEAKVYGYRYDQLNRITKMNAFDGHKNLTNNFDATTPIQDYNEQISYDPNGNILQYKRNGASTEKGISMDDLTYRYDYYTVAGQRKTYNPALPAPGDASRLTNMLNSVSDVAVETYIADINNQALDNYLYDEAGNLVQDKAEGLYDPSKNARPMIEWNVYGKITKITRIRDGVTTNISYTYDANGNRISKTVNGKSTYYVRDAVGNIISIYKYGEPSINNGHLSQTELHLYGSNRLGIYNTSTDVQECLNSIEPVITFTRGNKEYELTNHLGNVLVTITDRKLQHSSDGMLVDYYTADVNSEQDYYPGGMNMPGRAFNSTAEYRYGFNGKEKDKDAEVVQYDYGFRIYDPRLVRFKSLDPLQKKYPELTPYQFSSNRPIDGVDLDGKEYITFHVFITKGSDGKPVFRKHIAADYRELPAGIMAFIHNNGDYKENFYKYYSESFGREGRGFKWLYFDEKGNQMGDPVWQMRQSKSLYAVSDEYSGYYSGSGCITKFGPGLSDGRFSELNNDYDFSYKPMGYADAISKSHDMMQEKEIKQPQGWLEDVRTLKSDLILLKRADNGIFETIGDEYSREDFLRTSKISTFFSAVVRYKNWKIMEMKKQHLNINSVQDQLKVIFKDWDPDFLTKDWFAKKLLNESGGGARENQRNTIKPIRKKSP